jgi:hypothetical protein
VIKYKKIQQNGNSIKKIAQNETILKNIEKSNFPMFQCWTTNEEKLRICSKSKE